MVAEDILSHHHRKEHDALLFEKGGRGGQRHHQALPGTLTVVVQRYEDTQCVKEVRPVERKPNIMSDVSGYQIRSSEGTFRVHKVINAQRNGSFRANIEKLRRLSFTLLRHCHRQRCRI